MSGQSSSSNSKGKGFSAAQSTSAPQMSPQAILNLYNRNIPTTLGTTIGGVNQSAVGLAQGAAQANPIYTQSGLDQLRQYAPGYSQSGIDLTRQQTGGTADLLGGEGARAAQAADALGRQINPEYYNTRTNLANSSAELLNSFGKGGYLGGGEQAAAERAINQGNAGAGNLGNNNAMNTVANAMNFGDYARQKQALLGGAINTIGSNMGGMVNPMFNPVTLGSGNANASNFGLGTFNPNQSQNSMQDILGFGQSMFGNLASAGSSPISQSTASSSNWNSAGSQSIGGGCCFIFLEARNGFMPWFVRAYRDMTYSARPDIANGYRKMAKWLVPLMQRYNVVKWLVNTLMVKPLTKYGGWYYKQEGYETGYRYGFLKSFWFTVWSKV